MRQRLPLSDALGASTQCPALATKRVAQQVRAQGVPAFQRLVRDSCAHRWLQREWIERFHATPLQLRAEALCAQLSTPRRLTMLSITLEERVIPSCNSWSKKDIRGSIELLVSRSTEWEESQKRLPTCRLRGLMNGSSSVQRPGVSGAGR